jgi:2-C-methyl-D-erythritol 4-phosphate cytidylyltransferase
MYISAIVLAAGFGLRMKSNVTKPLIKINSQPILIYSLKILSNHNQIRDIVLVVNSKNSQRVFSLVEKYRIKKIKAIVSGGRFRQYSVMEGLKALDNRTDLVLIHDAVRPFINSDMVSSLIREAKRSGAAIVGVPVKVTIKQTRSHKPQATSKVIVEKTLDRNNLWEVQTPQVFQKKLIIQAYKRFGNTHVTDDANLVEKMGRKVRVLPGSYNNIKITTSEDLVIAEAIAKSLKG